MTAPLHADDLYRFYHAGDDETLALRGVSLALEQGEVVAVSGPSGSGKSTLLACLAGLDEPDGGIVYVGSERLSRRPEEERADVRARQIGMLFQEENLIGHLTIGQNIRVVQRLRSRRGGAERTELLGSVGIGSKANALPRHLSGGELARAGLAVAIANAPAVILADEPTGELDDETSARIIDLLRDRAKDGAAVLLVTHDPAVASKADRELRMRDGELEA